MQPLAVFSFPVYYQMQYLCLVKKVLTIFFILLLLLTITNGFAQCAICTKSAQQLGDKPARGLNLSILFLAFTPLILIGYLGYRWWISLSKEER
jgi:hypothetical protein